MPTRTASGQEIAETIRAMIGERPYFMAYYDQTDGSTHIVSNILSHDQLRFLEEMAEEMRQHGPITTNYPLAKPS